VAGALCRRGRRTAADETATSTTPGVHDGAFQAADLRSDSVLNGLEMWITNVSVGPIPATCEVLARRGLSIEEGAHSEINESFASVPLAWNATFGTDAESLNPRGGAIALGHPLGAPGCRAMTTRLHALEESGGRLGLPPMCGAGMANATIIERVL
jgi:acetyl-CoA acetyltransferase